MALKAHEKNLELLCHLRPGTPDTIIGEGARITKAVIDRGCNVPAGMVIGEDVEEDRKRFYVSENGVTLVIPEMLGQEIHHVR